MKYTIDPDVIQHSNVLSLNRLWYNLEAVHEFIVDSNALMDILSVSN
jgi:hypothetical protein